jgi:hypothetical protein
VAKPNRIFLRSLIFITLIVAVGSFIIGVNWPTNQGELQTTQITQPLSETSPLEPIHQDFAADVPQKATATPSAEQVFASKPFTTNPASSLKPDSPPNQPTLPTPEVRGRS